MFDASSPSAGTGAIGAMLTLTCSATRAPDRISPPSLRDSAGARNHSSIRHWPPTHLPSVFLLFLSFFSFPARCHGTS